MDSFETRLKKRMLELNIKQVDIVKKTGFSKTSVSRWLNGSVPRGEAFTNLAEYLKVTPDWLMGNTDLSNYVSLLWAGPGKQPKIGHIPNLSIVPYAQALDKEWELTGEVTILPTNFSDEQELGDLIAFMSNEVKDQALIVDTTISGKCSALSFSPIDGDDFIVNWHGNTLQLNISLTASGDLRFSSKTDSRFREESIAIESVDRAEVFILGKILMNITRN